MGGIDTPFYLSYNTTVLYANNSIIFHRYLYLLSYHIKNILQEKYTKIYIFSIVSKITILPYNFVFFG